MGRPAPRGPARLNPKIERFAAWLIATRRLRPSAEYLVARRPRVGAFIAREHPFFFATFQDTAAAIGFGPKSLQRQWAALALVCAVHGIPPDELNQAPLRPRPRRAHQRGHPAWTRHRKSLGTALFGLEATLFHAVVTGELPRRRTPDKAAERAAAWAAIPPVLATTMQRYLAQLALSLRPGTMRHPNFVLREFAQFLASYDPAVTCVAAVGRRHVEAYKAWLAERPANRGGALHRHTIRDRLGPCAASSNVWFRYF